MGFHTCGNHWCLVAWRAFAMAWRAFAKGASANDDGGCTQVSTTGVTGIGRGGDDPSLMGVHTGLTHWCLVAWRAFAEGASANDDRWCMNKILSCLTKAEITNAVLCDFEVDAFKPQSDLKVLGVQI